MNSVVIDGKVLDFKYKKLQPFHQAFYVGDILVGQLFNMDNYWTAIPNKPKCRVDGFVSRYWASEYCLRIMGLSE